MENLEGANYFPVTTKARGNMSTGFVDQTLDWL